MQTEIIRLQDAAAGDICCRILHKSGLEIRVTEMPGFSTAYAQFGAKFGAVNRRFRSSGTVTALPAGIAHYMEHKLFEQEYGDAAARFDAFGAACNAFTDYDRTVYHFRTQQNFDSALELLLRFVRTPFFTEEGVQRERGIIMQELLEALDDPSDAVFCQLLEGMYHAFPLSPHILGTAESIAAVTPALLTECHRQYYNLHNMVLCCTGNVTVQQVLEIADRVLQPAEPMTAESLFPQEPPEPAKQLCSRKMPVGKRMFALGFKSTPVSGEERLRESLLCSLTLDVLIGQASPLYQKLLQDGLLNDTFDTDCFAGDGWFAVLAEGESDDPQAVREAICAERGRLLKSGINPELFAALKKAAYGDSIIGMNHPEAVCTAMLDAYMWGCSSHFIRTKLLAGLTPDDVQRCLRERFLPDNTCLSVIEPESFGKEDTET